MQFSKLFLLFGLIFLLLGADLHAQEYRRGNRGNRNDNQNQEDNNPPQRQPQPRPEPEPEPEPEPQIVAITVEFIEKGTNRPATGALVEIEGREQKGRVPNDGLYMIELEEGERIQITVTGERYQDKTFTLGTDFERVTVDLPLQDTLTEVATVREQNNLGGSELAGVSRFAQDIEVVSVTRTKQSLADAPAVISVITAQDIRNRGYRDVGEAVNSLPGFDALHDYTSYNMGVRGVNGGLRARSNILKVLIDNQPIAFRSNNENWLGQELIPIEAVERIEVIRGPSSAVYGANAFLGVINIITKQGESAEGGVVALNGNLVQENPGGGVSAMYGNRIGNIDFMVSAQSQLTDRSGLQPTGANNDPDLLPTNAGATEDDTYFPASFFGKLTYNTNTGGQLGLDVNYQRLDVAGEMQDWALLTHQNYISLSNYWVRGRYTQDFAQNFRANVSATYAGGGPNGDEELYANAGSNIANLEYYTRDYGYNGVDAAADISYTFNDINSITIGADLSNDWQTPQVYNRVLEDGTEELADLGANRDADTLGTQTFTNAGVFLQGIVYPFQIAGVVNSLETFGLTVGGRFDYNNIYENVGNYRAGLVYKPFESIYTKLLFGTSFRAPTPQQIYSGIIASGTAFGNPDLNPERANTAEFAVGGNIGQFFNFNVSGFFSNIQDRIFLVPGAPNPTYQNVGDIEAFGSEVELRARSKFNLDAYVNFSLQQNSLTLDQTLIDEYNIEEAQEDELSTSLYPETMAKFGINYKVPAAFLQFNLEGRYFTGRQASQQNIDRASGAFEYLPYELDSYFLLDFMLASHEVRLVGGNLTRIEFRVNNLLDTEYFFPGFNTPGTGGETFAYEIPGLNRNFQLRIAQHF